MKHLSIFLYILLWLAVNIMPNLLNDNDKGDDCIKMYAKQAETVWLADKLYAELTENILTSE